MPAPTATIDAAKPAAVVILRAISRFPIPQSLRRRACRYAEANHLDAANRAVSAVVFGLAPLRWIGIGETSQRKLKRPHLTGLRQHLGLSGRELQCGGLSDYHLLSVLLLDRLIDCEHPDVR